MNPDLYQELVKQINSLQKQVDALVKPEVGRWVDWTPIVTQNVAVTYNAAASFARYSVSGDVVNLEIFLSITSAGTAGNAIVISGLPAAIQPTNSSGGVDPHVMGSAAVRDAGFAYYVGALLAVGANDLRIIAYGLGNYVGATPNFALANGDNIGFQATYER